MLATYSIYAELDKLTFYLPNLGLTLVIPQMGGTTPLALWVDPKGVGVAVKL